MTSRMEELWPSWLDTVLVWWDEQGCPRIMSGPWYPWGPAPGPLFAITAWNPGGLEQEDDENDRRHGELLRVAREEVGEPFGSSVDDWDDDWDDEEDRSVVRTWWPCAGAGLEVGPPELGVVLAGLTRAEAVDLGRRLGQLAIFELTDDRVEIVPCDGSPGDGRLRYWDERPQWSDAGSGGRWIDAQVVSEWWDRHARALRAHGIGVPPSLMCPNCGSSSVRWIAYGMPMEEPPAWVSTAGCIVPPDPPDRGCVACGLTWSSPANPMGP